MTLQLSAEPVKGSYADNDILFGVSRDALEAFEEIGIRTPTKKEVAQAVRRHLSTADVTKGINLRNLEDALPDGL